MKTFEENLLLERTKKFNTLQSKRFLEYSSNSDQKKETSEKKKPFNFLAKLIKSAKKDN